jgi:lipopolysaccharide export system permease protein
MRTTIDRYILWELTRGFLIALVLITVFLVLIGILTEAVRMNLGLMPTLRLIPFVLPSSLAFAVPGTILFTVCQVYGRMSAENEVVAVKAMGVSPLVLLWPAFLLSFLLSIVGVCLNDLAYSWGYTGMQRVVIESAEEIVYGMLRTQRSYANQRFSIIVKEVNGRRLIRPIMHFQPDGSGPAWTVSAVEAELQSNLERNTLVLILIDCEVDVAGARTVMPGRTVQEIPLTLASPKKSGDTAEVSPAHLPLSQIGRETERQLALIRELEQSLAAESALALLTGEFQQLHEETWRPKRQQLQNARLRLNRLRTEPCRRWAAGFSSLCFVLVGAPLAIRQRNSDVMSTFFRCFFPILIIYYPFFAYGLDQAKAGAVPPYTVWVGNIVLAMIGAVLLRRVIKY